MSYFRPLYYGNITYTLYEVNKFASKTYGAMRATTYHYDQLNRIKGLNAMVLRSGGAKYQ